MSALPADRACAALIRGLRPIAAPFAVLASRSQDWASATFEGARHRLALQLDGDDAAARAMRLAETLPALDLPIDGGFVADIAVTTRIDGGRPVLGIEALTIREAAEAAARGSMPAGSRRAPDTVGHATSDATITSASRAHA